MTTQDFFKEYVSTRPNLKSAFHDSGIEGMAFAEAYHNHKNKEMLNVNRLEVIDDNGRSYLRMNVRCLEISLQDAGKTLKIFLNKN